jgi:hypothetical protein
MQLPAEESSQIILMINSGKHAAEDQIQIMVPPIMGSSCKFAGLEDLIGDQVVIPWRTRRLMPPGDEPRHGLRRLVVCQKKL